MIQTLTILYSYWLHSSNRRGRRRGPHQHRYKPSLLLQCHNCRKIPSINLLRLYISLHLSLTVGSRQLHPASLQCLKQVFLKAVHHQLRPTRLQTFHLIYSHFYKMHRDSRRLPHNHHHKAQCLCLARTTLSRQHFPQGRCVPRCHRIWQGHHHLPYRCKVG